MVKSKGGFACLGFHDGYVMRRCKGGKLGFRLRINHATARHDHRLFRRPDRGNGRCQFLCIRLGPAEAPDFRREKAFGPVKGLGLHILAEGQRHRPGFGRVCHHPQRARQGCQQLFGPRDPVEIARYRAETVIRRDRAIPEHLDLLQHRVGRAVGKDIAGDQQHRNAVYVGKGGGCDHVQGTGADRCRHRHRPAALCGLGIGNGRMCHGLFVMPAPSRQHILDAMQRLADAGHIAMAEDRPDAFDEASAVFGFLHRQPAHHRLRCGKPDRCHAVIPFCPRAPSQIVHSR